MNKSDLSFKRFTITLAFLFCSLFSIALVAETTGSNDPVNIANLYLSAWQESDYTTMYNFLSIASKQYISRGEFIDNQSDFADKYAIGDYYITETTNQGSLVVVYYELLLQRIGGSSTSVKKGMLKTIIEHGNWAIDY